MFCALHYCHCRCCCCGCAGDLWSSVDDGVTWTLIAAQTSIGNYSFTSMVFDSRYFLYLFGGQNGAPNTYNWTSISARSTVPITNPFNFALYGSQLYEADCFVAALVAPQSFAVTGSGSVSAPTGTFLIFGDQFGAAILPPAPSTAGATASASTTLVSGPVAFYGAVGCAQRSSSNRFYLLGTPASIDVVANLTGDVYYNYASNDGQTWTNVLDQATTNLWRSRFDDDFTMCVVDLSNNVYSVGSATTWVSSNQGVTFTLQPSSGPRFANRTYFAGGIFTSQITGQDKIMVVGGRDAPTASNVYGGNDYNDVRTTPPPHHHNMAQHSPMAQHSTAHHQRSTVTQRAARRKCSAPQRCVDRLPHPRPHPAQLSCSHLTLRLFLCCCVL